MPLKDTAELLNSDLLRLLHRHKTLSGRTSETEGANKAWSQQQLINHFYTKLNQS